MGKSTLASRYVDEHRLAIALDLDRLRLLAFGAADVAGVPAMNATRDLALGAARAHLRAGRDVVVPQYLGRPDYLEALEALAVEMHADFHEIVLMDSEQRLAQRFAERTAAATRLEHVAAAAGIQDEGPESLAAMRQRLVELVATRPHAVVIECPEGTEDITYRAVLRAIGEPA